MHTSRTAPATLIRSGPHALTLGGAWTARNVAPVDTQLAALVVDGKAVVTVDARSITALDTAGAWVLHTLLAHPSRLRWRPILFNIQRAGFDALPIVGLLSFLLGVVVAYQGAAQLRQYGANIFVADLVGLSMLRELAPLITAITRARALRLGVCRANWHHGGDRRGGRHAHPGHCAAGVAGAAQDHCHGGGAALADGVCRRDGSGWRHGHGAQPAGRGF